MEHIQINALARPTQWLKQKASERVNAGGLGQSQARKHELTGKIHQK